jgi:solute carrier family 31 (copper transporter), member 1
MTLEALRRAGKEYDRYLIRQAYAKMPASSVTRISEQAGGKSSGDENCSPPRSVQIGQRTFRPNIFQHLIRATLHMLTFTVAYFVMLIVMYYNGYLIICVIIGAFLGSFIFSWETLTLGYVSTAEESDPRCLPTISETKEEVTLCCG